MAINLNKILTISPQEWSEISGKNLRDYNVVGIQYQVVLDLHFNSAFTNEFSERVPDKAEVVVGYKCTSATVSPSGSSGDRTALIYATGTALIPKHREEPIKDDED